MADDGPERADPDGPPDATPSGVRDGTADDLSALLRIQAVSLPDPSPAFLRTGLRAGLVLVAEPLPGDGTVSPLPDDGTTDPLSGDTDVASHSPAVTSTPRPEPVGYILHTVDDRTVYAAEMAVAPGHRRRGHGSRLLEGLAVRYADREELRLTTRRSNEAALALYERLGFRVERRLPGHYEEGTGAGESDAGEPDEESGAEDGLLLVRDL